MIERLQNIGKDRFVLLFLAGLMLVIIAIPTGEKKEEKTVKKESAEEQTQAVAEETEIEVYRERLCRQLEEFLQSMDGVGKTKVYITMHSSAEIIVERNSPYSKRTEEEVSKETSRTVGETENDSEVVLTQQADGSEAPIVIKEIVPVVKGVVVAAQGGDDMLIKKEITELVMALFGIEEHKIKVVKLTT